jgi:hypothetical protein
MRQFSIMRYFLIRMMEALVVTRRAKEPIGPSWPDWLVIVLPSEFYGVVVVKGSVLVIDTVGNGSGLA